MIIDGPIPVNLDLAKLATTERIINFFSPQNKGTFEEILASFLKDVETWKGLYVRRLAEIENELETARQSWMLSGQTKAHQLMNEREEIKQNPPFIWLAKLYGSAVESYLASTQRKIRSGKMRTATDPPQWGLPRSHEYVHPWKKGYP